MDFFSSSYWKTIKNRKGRKYKPLFPSRLNENTWVIPIEKIEDGIKEPWGSLLFDEGNRCFSVKESEFLTDEERSRLLQTVFADFDIDVVRQGGAEFEKIIDIKAKEKKDRAGNLFFKATIVIFVLSMLAMFIWGMPKSGNGGGKKDDERLYTTEEFVDELTTDGSSVNKWYEEEYKDKK